MPGGQCPGSTLVDCTVYVPAADFSTAYRREDRGWGILAWRRGGTVATCKLHSTMHMRDPASRRGASQLDSDWLPRVVLNIGYDIRNFVRCLCTECTRLPAAADAGWLESNRVDVQSHYCTALIMSTPHAWELKQQATRLLRPALVSEM